MTFVGSSDVERAEEGGGVGRLAARAKKESRKEGCDALWIEEEREAATPGMEEIGGSSTPPTWSMQVGQLSPQPAR